MSFVIQSQKVRRKSKQELIGNDAEEKKQELLGNDTTEKKQKTERNDTIKRSPVNMKFSLPTSSQIPTCDHRTAQSLGMRCSSLVSRSQKKQSTERNRTDIQVPTNYKICEDPMHPVQFADLPHPSQLFGKRVKADVKRRMDKVNSVEMHLKQLKSIQTKWGDKEKPQVKSKLQNEKSPSEIRNTVDGVSQLQKKATEVRSDNKFTFAPKVLSEEWDDFELWMDDQMKLKYNGEMKTVEE